MEQNGLCFSLLNGPTISRAPGLGVQSCDSGEDPFRRWFLMCGSTVRIGSAYKELETQAAEFRLDMLKNEKT